MAHGADADRLPSATQDVDTVNNSATDQSRQYKAHVYLASMRMVADMSDLSAARIILPTGQSGVRGTPHYDDQIEHWLHGDLKPMHFTTQQIANAAQHHIALTPEDASAVAAAVSASRV